MSALHELGAVELWRLLHARELGAVELARHFLERIEPLLFPTRDYGPI